MRSRIVALVAVAVLIGACGGSAATDEAEPDPTPPALPTAGPTVPDEMALVDGELVIEGDTEVAVVPGETVTVNHLVHNQADASRSLGLRHQIPAPDGDETPVGLGDEPFEVELSLTTTRVEAGQILPVTSVVEVPADAELGAVLVYDVVVVDVDDIGRRSSTTVELTVTDAAGSPPELGPDIGVTSTNKTVLVYVVGDDSDPDGDLDLASLRVVAGGFYADETSANSQGTVTYVPFANVTGADIVLYELCDLEQRCRSALVTITVEG